MPSIISTLAALSGFLLQADKIIKTMSEKINRPFLIIPSFYFYSIPKYLFQASKGFRGFGFHSALLFIKTAISMNDRN